MERKEDREILRKSGFAEGEMNRLSQLRRDRNERERKHKSQNNGPNRHKKMGGIDFTPSRPNYETDFTAETASRRRVRASQHIKCAHLE